MQPAFDCKDCPLGCYENCSNYEDEECLSTIKHAIEKGDIKLYYVDNVDNCVDNFVV
jgi:hypothetical protein